MLNVKFVIAQIEILVDRGFGIYIAVFPQNMACVLDFQIVVSS
jgi:hypothetical protein